MNREQKLEAALRLIVMGYDGRNPMRTGAFHGMNCSCHQCDIDRIRAALATPPDADTRVVSVADILTAAIDEYLLQHVTETDWHRSGRHAAVSGLMVRLGLYPLLDQAIKELLYRAGLEGEDQ